MTPREIDAYWKQRPQHPLLWDKRDGFPHSNDHTKGNGYIGIVAKSKALKRLITTLAAARGHIYKPDTLKPSVWREPNDYFHNPHTLTLSLIEIFTEDIIHCKTQTPEPKALSTD